MKRQKFKTFKTIPQRCPQITRITNVTYSWSISDSLETMRQLAILLLQTNSKLLVLKLECSLMLATEITHFSEKRAWLHVLQQSDRIDCVSILMSISCTVCCYEKK